ncbi:MAG: PDZ domain-containing protein, partial [Polyangiales bacterium]
ERRLLLPLQLMLGGFGAHLGKFGGPGVLQRRHDESHILYDRAIAPAVSASRAGIVEGDEIVTIEDDDANKLSERDLDYRLRGKPGSKLRVRVRHEGEERDVVIERVTVE